MITVLRRRLARGLHRLALRVDVLSPEVIPLRRRPRSTWAANVPPILTANSFSLSEADDLF